jgi:oligoendopeptidase F
MEFDPATDVPDRDTVPQRYRWDPTILFDSPAEWTRELESLETAVEDLREYEGEVLEDGETLLAALETFYGLRERQGPLFAYAKLRTLEDTTDERAGDVLARYERVKASIDDAASYLEPAIGRAGRERIERLVETTPGLERYDHHLDEVLRRSGHTRSPDVESVLAELEPSLESPARVLAALKNEDVEAPTVETPDGEEATVTTHTIGRLLERPDRAFRRRVYGAYHEELGRHRAASARAYGDRIETNVRLARIRDYDSALAATLEGTFPPSAYEAVVDGLEVRLDPFHRHLELYRAATDGEDLRPWDLQVPLTDGEKPTIPYDRARELAVAAVAPLGEDYRADLASFLEDDRVDVFETTDRRSEMRGMNVPAHGAGSFVLLNYKNDLESLYYFVNELGHAMHAERY